MMLNGKGSLDGPTYLALGAGGYLGNFLELLLSLKSSHRGIPLGDTSMRASMDRAVGWGRRVAVFVPVLSDIAPCRGVVHDVSRIAVG
jgi:hypothetical protein